MGIVTTKWGIFELRESWDGDTQSISLYVNGVVRSTLHSSANIITYGGLQILPDGVFKVAHFANPDAWAALTGYLADDMVSGDELVWKCTQGGISGASEPTWPESGTIVDGTVTWEMVDGIIYFTSRDKGRTWQLS